MSEIISLYVFFGVASFVILSVKYISFKEKFTNGNMIMVVLFSPVHLFLVGLLLFMYVLSKPLEYVENKFSWFREVMK